MYKDIEKQGQSLYRPSRLGAGVPVGDSAGVVNRELCRTQNFSPLESFECPTKIEFQIFPQQDFKQKILGKLKQIFKKKSDFTSHALCLVYFTAACLTGY